MLATWAVKGGVGAILDFMQIMSVLDTYTSPFLRSISRTAEVTGCNDD